VAASIKEKRILCLKSNSDLHGEFPSILTKQILLLGILWSIEEVRQNEKYYLEKVPFFLRLLE
jgi:hypothetical protein